MGGRERRMAQSRPATGSRHRPRHKDRQRHERPVVRSSQAPDQQWSGQAMPTTVVGCQLQALDMRICTRLQNSAQTGVTAGHGPRCGTTVRFSNVRGSRTHALFSPVRLPTGLHDNAVGQCLQLTHVCIVACSCTLPNRRQPGPHRVAAPTTTLRGEKSRSTFGRR